jgi:NADH-quinone oxidoreductase subunit H
LISLTASNHVTPELKGFLLVTSAKVITVFAAIFVGVMMVVWAERRVSGWIQLRLGPNRVGPQGLLQLPADGMKSLFKEEFFPVEADRWLFALAPAVRFVPAFLLFAVIPFAAPLPLSFDFTLPWLGRFVHEGVTPMMIADLPIGFLLILAFSSIGVYGMVLAGWSSSSKYALLGGLRSSAQMVSYEIALGMSLIVVMILAGNVTLTGIVVSQQDAAWLVLPATVAFLLFAVSALAETNRLPFDLPEAEAELVAGYHTEYSAMKMLVFLIAEYAVIITMSALIATIFFGGWDIPFTSWDDIQVEGGSVVGQPSVLKTLATLAAFSLKTLFFIFWYIWVRWTLPRFRFDQLMALGWKVLLPATLVYVVVFAAAVWALVDEGAEIAVRDSLVLFVLNIILLVIFMGIIDRGRLIAGSSVRLQRRRSR